MNRFLFCFLALCLSVHVLSAQIAAASMFTKEKQAEKKRLKIRRDYELEQRYDSVTGKLNSSVDTTGFREYDREGRVTHDYYIREGEENNCWYFYDAQGRLVRMVMGKSDSLNGYIHQFAYNDRGDPKLETVYSRKNGVDVFLSRSHVIYDESGRVTAQAEYDNESDFASLNPPEKKFFTYDEKDRQIFSATLTNEGDTMYKDSTIYFEGKDDYVRRSYVKERDGWMIRSYYHALSGRAGDHETRQHLLVFYTGNRPDTSFNDSLVLFDSSHVLESYSKDIIEKYTRDRKGEFQYCEVYDKRMRPQARRTRYVLYYE